MDQTVADKTFIEALPRNASGKILNTAVARALLGRPVASCELRWHLRSITNSCDRPECLKISRQGTDCSHQSSGRKI